MTVICDYCEKIVSCKSSLVRHQKSKACLESRNMIEQLLDKYNCKYCNKSLASKQRFDQHLTTCLSKFKKLLEDKDKLIEDKDKLIEETYKRIYELEKEVETIRLKTELDLLRKDCKHKQEVIERIAEQPKTTTNTTNLVLPMIDTSHERIELMVRENYTENHLLGGQAGVAQFTKDNLLVDSEHNLGF